MFIRDLICIDKEMGKEKDVFYNNKEIDDVELKNLKEKSVNRLPGDNFFKLTVTNL